MSVIPKKPCKGERLVTPGATRGTRDVSNPQQVGLPAVWQGCYLPAITPHAAEKSKEKFTD